jgi:2'-5' RNA ligase
VNDLFPCSLAPRAIGFDVLPHVAPVFFAIYPSADDLSRVVAWQNRVCRLLEPPAIARRPPELLHISVALCGTSRRRRQPLASALRLAEERFAHPAFDLTLVALARFGADGRACVAVADAAGTRCVDDLRVALADAQAPLGLKGSRAKSEAHLTLGYRDRLPDLRREIEPMRLRVEAVDLVLSHVGESHHTRLARWRLK